MNKKTYTVQKRNFKKYQTLTYFHRSRYTYYYCLHTSMNRPIFRIHYWAFTVLGDVNYLLLGLY